MAYIKLNSDTLNNSSKNMGIIDELIMKGISKQKQEMMRNALLSSMETDNYIVPDNTQAPLDYLGFNQSSLPESITPYNIGEERIPNANAISLPELINNVTSNNNINLDSQDTQNKSMTAKNDISNNTTETQKELSDKKVIDNEITKKKKELSLLELLQKGFTSAFKNPITEKGETSNIYDMLRGATAVMAPKQSAIMEQELQDLKNIEQSKLLAQSKQDEQSKEFEQKLYLEAVKNKLKEQEEMTTSDKRFANTIIESTLKDKFVEGYKDALKEANYIKTVINSGSSYSLDTIITKLVRMSGDPRVSDQDRQAYQNALGFFQGLNQKTRKMISGGKVSKGSPAYKAIMSMTDELLNVSSNGLRNSLASTEERLSSYGYKPEWSSELMNSYYNQYGVSNTGNKFKIIKREVVK
jgi:hypothetical protein